MSGVTTPATKRLRDLQPGDEILVGVHEGTVVGVDPSGYDLLKLTFDADTVVNPPGIDYSHPDREYKLR